MWSRGQDIIILKSQRLRRTATGGGRDALALAAGEAVERRSGCASTDGCPAASREPTRYIWMVDVEFDSTRPLGLRVDIDKALGLVVHEVKPGGVIDRWNQRCSVTFPFDEVRKGDVILRANDVEGSIADKVAAMKQPGELLMVIART